ncbi:ATP-binding cassette domain-containing protein [Thalassorhabdus alkalitolerans]|uniref:ATP-binding cassette domain-containing protein n=1 Tax=Thalassorhabdus alkalitolerans TaxID=2282697 RepID=A0ABW0YQF7_9BACI|nr:phosphate ABC transporter ATP-binding protein [Thalassobacillus sp. C254]
MAEIVFELCNVSTEHLNDVNLSLEEGKISCLFGPSGAGKSSILYLLNRLSDQGAGDIYYRGTSLASLPVQKLRRDVGMVFQESALFEGTVEDNLKYGPALHHSWSPNDGEKLLRKVKLPAEFLSKSADSLSGGEKQRVALARTLANDPDVLLLDEVTSALDVKSTEAIEELLKNVVKNERKTIVMVSHNINQIRRLADYAYFIDKGKVIEEGPPESLISEPKTKWLRLFLKDSIS